MLKQEILTIKRIVMVAFMSACIAFGAFVVIPFGIVPFSLQTLFVSLSGLILGFYYGPIAVILYLFSGSIGLPIFASGTAGLGILLGPTGGYLFAFILSSFLCGLASGKGTPLFKMIFLCFLADALVLLIGSWRLGVVLDIPLLQAFSVGLIPFTPAAVVKTSLAIVIYRSIRHNKLFDLK